MEKSDELGIESNIQCLRAYVFIHAFEAGILASAAINFCFIIGFSTSLSPTGLNGICALISCW
jgi:hypothetical protein